MPLSPRKRLSNARYNDKCDPIQFRPRKSVGAAIRAAAKAAGQSLQGYILQACAERMTREGQPLELPDDQSPAE